MTYSSPESIAHLTKDIRHWSRELGFQQTGFTRVDLSNAGKRLQQWLDSDFHGSMEWMGRHGSKRWQPAQLMPGTVSVICVRMDYLPADSGMIACLKDGDKAYLSRYALGRDYHKLMRKRLATLANRIETACGQPVLQRAFVDSAPVMEKPLAEQAGLGWIGKNTLLLNRHAGSWFFLGELYTSLELQPDQPEQEKQCGQCRACQTVCPTDAFPAPYVLDARRCISYLTIENKGVIPVEFRKAIGNRVFGCDDCQIICPWNRFASPTGEQDFHPRHDLDNSALMTLFNWSEQEFLRNTAGSPIRRIGYQQWARNLAVGLGNAPYSEALVATLQARLEISSALVKEHIVWAVEQQLSKQQISSSDGNTDSDKY
ncbi:MAG: tRNA epoxyqueuosine(34) reductase QueG [Gammaproteobacteria bacterium]|nr:MAG: tRNA epoxyqueuosine(34) reductase QueG [Gammaproteobacteria bacterium]